MMSGQAITWVLATVVALVQPRFLGDVGQGHLRLAYSMWMIVDVIIGFGTTTHLTLQMARDRERGLALVRPILRWRFVGYLAGWAVMSGYLLVSGADGQLVIVIILIGFVTMITSAAGTARAALVGLENMRYPAIADVAAKVVSVSAVIIVLLAGGDVIAVSAVAIGAALVNAVLLFRYLALFPAATTQVRVPLRLVALGGVSYLVADAALIVYQQVDTVIISLLVDEEQLGWYAAADQLFASLLFVPTILMMTLFPVFGRLSEESPERLRSVVSRAITSLLLFSVPIGLGTIAVGPAVASLIFGPQFVGAGPVLAVLGVVIIITSETILIGRYAIAVGHQRFWNLLMVAGIMATIPLDLMLVPWTNDRYGNGAIGGALAYVVTETMMFVIGTVRFARDALVPATAARAARILAAGALMLIAVWPFRDAFIALPVTVGAVVYGLGIWLTRALDPDERALVARVTRRLTRTN